MFEFINSLPIPTGICNFDGEFIDINNVMQDRMAMTKSRLFSLKTFDIFGDNSVHNTIVDSLSAGKKIVNKKIIILTNGEIKLLSSSVSLLSEEKELMLFQNHQVDLKAYSTYEKFSALLDEILDFNPNLDQSLIEQLKIKTLESNIGIDSTAQHSKFHFSTKNFKIEEISTIFKTPLDILQGKWTFLIIMVLMRKGTLRFNELLIFFEKSLSARILSLELKKLESHGLINRKVYPTVPPTVEYNLTKKGEALNAVANVLCDWSSKYTNNNLFNNSLE